MPEEIYLPKDKTKLFDECRKLKVKGIDPNLDLKRPFITLSNSKEMIKPYQPIPKEV